MHSLVEETGVIDLEAVSTEVVESLIRGDFVTVTRGLVAVLEEPDEDDRLLAEFALHLELVEDELEVAVEARVMLYLLLWNLTAQTSAPRLRALLLPFHSLQHDARDTASWELVEALPRGCRWLAEIDEDDLAWTGFKLPGEPSD